MPPRKNRPVLFEVVARAQRARARSPSPPTAPAQPPPPASTAAPPPRAPSPAPAPSLPDAAARPVIARAAGGRIQLSLTRPQAAIAVAGVLVLLGAAFIVGRRSAEPPVPGAPTIEDIFAGTTAPETPPPVVSAPTPGQGRGPGAVATPAAPLSEPAPTAPVPVREGTPRPKPADDFVLTPGAYYVVVQHFRLRDGERAAAAQDFLRSKGVECVIRTGADLQLVATGRFESEQQAETLRTRIVELGKEYREAGGGYDFASAKARKF